MRTDITKKRVMSFSSSGNSKNLKLLQPKKQIEGPLLSVKNFHFSQNPELAELEKAAHKLCLEYVFDLVFENGAVYRGYMDDGVREGPGV